MEEELTKAMINGMRRRTGDAALKNNGALTNAIINGIKRNNGALTNTVVNGIKRNNGTGAALKNNGALTNAIINGIRNSVNKNNIRGISNLKGYGGSFPNLKGYGGSFPNLKGYGGSFPNLKGYGGSFPNLKRYGGNFRTEKRFNGRGSMGNLGSFRTEKRFNGRGSMGNSIKGTVNTKRNFVENTNLGGGTVNTKRNFVENTNLGGGTVNTKRNFVENTNLGGGTVNTDTNFGQSKNFGQKRKYVHHHKRGDVIHPGVGLNILKRSVHMLKKKRIQRQLELAGITKTRKYRKSYYEKRLLKAIRPIKRYKKVYSYKE
jgi:hypothetical protein